MGDTYVSQTQNITKSTKNIETEIKNSVQNINVDLSKLDMSGAIDSFKRLETVAKAANFDGFISKIITLQETFVSFQKSVQTSNTSITNFAKSAGKLSGGQSAIVTNVEVNTGDISAEIGSVSANVSSQVSGMSESIGSCATDIGKSFSQIGTSALDFGNGIAIAASGISGFVDSISNLFISFQALGKGLAVSASSMQKLVGILPALGSSMLKMAENMSGIFEYLPELVVFLAILLVLSLLGEGLQMAGNGLLNIGLGLSSMSEGMAALLAFMPLFIESLAGITDNVEGILLFVLLAASILLMAVALSIMNEHLSQFVESMKELAGLMSLGFVAAFLAFGVILIGMSLFLEKIASGMQKVTNAISKQISKLAVLNPLLAAQAILTNPILGSITVGLAIAGGLLVKSLLPAMATGGIVSSPTIAMVGEGRYPEAVVPLGDSPQFTSMKADIANAVIMALNATGGMTNKSAASEIVLNIDGTKLARVMIPNIDKERSRVYSAEAREE